jgi:hypothetical protein
MNLVDENEVAALLVRYGFDLGGQSAVAVARSWGAKYDPSWLAIAVIESLHLGRYKAVSVEQVLNTWQRRGNVAPHFNAEFAAMITGQDNAAEDSTDCATDDIAAESLLDAEIALLSAHEIDEAQCSTTGLELSDPALDEGFSELPLSPPHQLLVTSKHQVSLDLTPTDYPPTLPRPPQSEWLQPETFTDVFTPSAQVSQFYYKLRAMATPIQPLDEPPIAADG